MEEILGTYDDHVELLRWAKERNEKLFSFIPGLDQGPDRDELRVVFAAPWSIYNWMRYNCYINCMQNHFREKYGDDYLET